MFKYDENIIVLSNKLRKIVSELLNEENYSSELIEIEPSNRRYYKKRKKH